MEKIHTSDSDDSLQKKFDAITIPEVSKQELAKYGLKIKELIRRGKYASVYQIQIDQSFDANRVTNHFKRSFTSKTFPQKDSQLAVKYINIKKREDLGVSDVRKAVDNEINALLTIRNDNIVQFYFVIDLSEKNEYYFVMELAVKDLQSYIKQIQLEKKTISESTAKTCIKSLSNALIYLHENGIIHKTIKSSNTLVFNVKQNESDFKVKLADFVSAKIVSKDILKDKDNDQTIKAEDLMIEDIFDLHFLFNEILNNVSFRDQTNKDSSQELIRKMMTTEGNSRQILKSILIPGNWLEC